MKREKEEEEETPQGKGLEKRNRVEKKEREKCVLGRVEIHSKWGRLFHFLFPFICDKTE